MILIISSTKTSASENKSILGDDNDEIEYVEYGGFLSGKKLQLPKTASITLDGIQYRAFTLEQYKELSNIVIVFRDLQDDVMELEEVNMSLLNEIDLWEKNLKIQEGLTKNQKERADELSKMFNDENELRLKIQRNHKLTNWVPWAISGVLAGLLAGLGTYSWVRSVR